MPNLFDYLDWRGNKTFAEEPFCDVDALAMAVLVYPDIWDDARGEESVPVGRATGARSPEVMRNDLQLAQYRFLWAAGKTRRFGEIPACRFASRTDTEVGIQFAAICFEPEGAGRVLSFRGTDGTTVGWCENFKMFYESPVPAQAEAVRYLTEAAASYDGPIVLTGHSKGGNLAAYAAVHAPQEVQDRISAVWCFDSPGLSEETMATEAYARIKARLHCVIPQGSVVGLLLESIKDPNIVLADAVGLRQHNPFTWQLDPPGVFETASGPAFTSKVVDRSMREWMSCLIPEQREKATRVLLRVMESSGAKTTSEMRQSLLSALPRILQELGDLDDETRAIAQSMTKSVLSGAAGAITEEASRLLNRLIKRIRAQLRRGDSNEHNDNDA